MERRPKIRSTGTRLIVFDTTRPTGRTVTVVDRLQGNGVSKPDLAFTGPNSQRLHMYGRWTTTGGNVELTFDRPQQLRGCRRGMFPRQWGDPERNRDLLRRKATANLFPDELTLTRASDLTLPAMRSASMRMYLRTVTAVYAAAIQERFRVRQSLAYTRDIAHIALRGRHFAESPWPFRCQDSMSQRSTTIMGGLQHVRTRSERSQQPLRWAACSSSFAACMSGRSRHLGAYLPGPPVQSGDDRQPQHGRRQ